jgi:hypothetical protein
MAGGSKPSYLYCDIEKRLINKPLTKLVFVLIGKFSIG